VSLSKLVKISFTGPEV